MADEGEEKRDEYDGRIRGMDRRGSIGSGTKRGEGKESQVGQVSLSLSESCTRSQRRFSDFLPFTFPHRP